ncbi:rod shape-determining protein MreC [PVC group bacterium (ex Bugula neritina AB1)]|nr:rod shape-determining protein MreC [PVC group bacterium (ex Bugula neritina AB1)]
MIIGVRNNAKVIIFSLFLIPIIFLNCSDLFIFTKRFTFNLISPFVTSLDFITKKSFALANRLAYPKWLVIENQKLNQKIDDLETTLVYFKEIEDENARLYDLLDFQKTLLGETVPAQVIGKDSSKWRKTLILNKGKKDDVDKNMPVVTSNGLVGMIIEVGNSLSRMILVNDPSFKVSALLQTSRIEGIFQGQGSGKAVIRYVDAKKSIYPQDIVITSGLGGLFPKGLILGGVESTKKTRDSLFQKIYITPSVRFSSLEEVLILKKTSDS